MSWFFAHDNMLICCVTVVQIWALALSKFRLQIEKRQARRPFPIQRGKNSLHRPNIHFCKFKYMGEEGRDAIGGPQVLPFIVCPHKGHNDTEAFYFNEEGKGDTFSHTWKTFISSQSIIKLAAMLLYNRGRNACLLCAFSCFTPLWRIRSMRCQGLSPEK